MNNQVTPTSPTTKILRSFVVSFVALIVISLVIALFSSKTYEVTRRIEITASVDKIFPLVADFSKWKQWSPWYQIEPTAKFQFTGNLSQKESTYAWDGKIIGKGQMRLKDMIPPQTLTFEMQFEKPKTKHAISEFTFDEKNRVTTVTWKDVGDLSYPLGRLFKKNISEMLAHDLEEGLKNLKTTAEKP